MPSYGGAVAAGSDGDSNDHTDGNTQGPAVIPDISQTLKADMCNNSDRVKEAVVGPRLRRSLNLLLCCFDRTLSPYRLQSIMEASQGRSSRREARGKLKQRPQRSAVSWLVSRLAFSYLTYTTLGPPIWG